MDDGESDIDIGTGIGRHRGNAGAKRHYRQDKFIEQNNANVMSSTHRSANP